MISSSIQTSVVLDIARYTPNAELKQDLIDILLDILTN